MTTDKPHFKLVFEDDSIFEGISLAKDWHNAPTKRVKEMIFSFAGVTILLKNYTQYNHLFETVAIVGGQKRISKFLIMGVKEKTTDVFEYNLVDKKFARRISKIGEEYRGMKIVGWKPGYKNGKAEFHYVKQ